MYNYSNIYLLLRHSCVGVLTIVINQPERMNEISLQHVFLLSRISHLHYRHHYRHRQRLPHHYRHATLISNDYRKRQKTSRSAGINFSRRGTRKNNSHVYFRELVCTRTWGWLVVLVVDTLVFLSNNRDLRTSHSGAVGYWKSTSVLQIGMHFWL